MINTTNFSLFPSDELYTFAKRALAIVEEKRTGVPTLIPLLDRTTQQFSLYQNALEREKKNPYTSLLSAKDHLRDAAFMVLRTYAEAMSYRIKEGWASASQKIIEVIRRYGWSAASFGYKAESAAINNMTAELRGKCATEVQLINAEEYLAELEAAQKDFESVAHLSVTNAPSGDPTIWDVRPNLSNSLKSLFSLISLLNASTPSNDLAMLETTLNELVVKSLASVKAADTRTEKQKTETSSNETVKSEEAAK